VYQDQNFQVNPPPLPSPVVATKEGVFGVEVHSLEWPDINSRHEEESCRKDVEPFQGGKILEGLKRFKGCKGLKGFW
jgi:hypothetical protein